MDSPSPVGMPVPNQNQVHLGGESGSMSSGGSQDMISQRLEHLEYKIDALQHTVEELVKELKYRH